MRLHRLLSLPNLNPVNPKSPTSPKPSCLYLLMCASEAQLVFEVAQLGLEGLADVVTTSGFGRREFRSQKVNTS